MNSNDSQLIDYERIGNYNVALSHDEESGYYYAMLDNLKARPGERTRVRFYENKQYEATLKQYGEMIVWARAITDK